MTLSVIFTTTGFSIFVRSVSFTGPQTEDDPLFKSKLIITMDNPIFEAVEQIFCGINWCKY